MIKALTTSATGLEAQQANIDRIANDLANVNTDGYKHQGPGRSTGREYRFPDWYSTGHGSQGGLKSQTV
jgi:flagellar basal body rod protein FlgG